MVAVTMLAVILATASHWIALGCPVGFACGACQTSLGGRMIVASSDHLLTHISLFSDTKSAVLDVEGCVSLSAEARRRSTARLGVSSPLGVRRLNSWLRAAFSGSWPMGKPYERSTGRTSS